MLLFCNYYYYYYESIREKVEMAFEGWMILKWPDQGSGMRDFKQTGCFCDSTYKWCLVLHLFWDPDISFEKKNSRKNIETEIH